MQKALTGLHITLNDFSIICRICLKKEVIKPISETCFMQLFKKSVDSEIEQDLPKNICQECSLKLEEFNNLTNLVQKSYEVLKKIVEDDKNSSTFVEIAPEIGTEIFDKESEQTLYIELTNTYTCSQNFSTKQDFINHSNEISSCHLQGDTKNFKCNNCQQYFSSKFKLNCHNRQHHKIFECKVCLKKFKYGPNLRRHDKFVHKGLRPHKCEICGKEFATLTRKTEHIHIHTGERPYVCSYCGTGFKKHSTKYAHETRHKIKNGEILKPDKKPKTYPRKVLHGPSEINCTICKKSFSSKQALMAHTKIHLGEKSFLCTVCGNGFLRKSHLEVHQRIHTGEKPYKCQECGKCFRQPSCYRNHMLIHKGQRSFVCKICQKSFIQGSHLRSHLKTHSGDKPYTCTLCGKSFAQNGNLKAHTRVHTGEKVYHCDVCPAKYNDSATLENHKIVHNKVEIKIQNNQSSES